MNESPPGSNIFIDCPACGRNHVQARAYAYQITNEVGIVVDQTFWVECLTCRAQLLSSAHPDDLMRMDKEARQAVITVYIPLVARALALLSLLVGCFPMVGGAVALLAVSLNRRPGFWRTLSWIGLGITVLSHGTLAVMIIVQAIFGTKP
ncbi:MAG: hypothetical protein HY289_10735 [Planctomycetes bacterium]|nr:hypothetical protein [Planctomycetota bacterium]